MNLIDVLHQFPTEDECLAYVECRRWPDGTVRCTTCGCSRVSRITRKTPSKNKRARIYQCLEPTCKLQFSATSGTIFNDSHLPLRTWFMAMALIGDAKKGMSARQLQRHLAIGSYKTAWYLCHRIRKAMEGASPILLTGIVEVDETYVGGRIKLSKTRRSGRLTKEMVVGIKERGGRLRLQHVNNLKASTVADVIRDSVDVDSVEMVMTDESTIYPGAALKAGISGRKHFSVNHGSGEFSRGIVTTNGVESAFSLLKRGIIGSFHRISPKHLHRYLTEFEFRFNERKNKGMFGLTAELMCAASPMSYRQLIAPPAPPAIA